MRIRYTSWDGSQNVTLDAQRLFDRLAAHLSAAGDVAEALRRLLQEGPQEDGFEMLGADELADRVRAAIQQLYDRYNLSRSLEDPWNDADDVVALETDAVARMAQDGERERRLARLEALSRILEQRLAELSALAFEDPEARSRFDALQHRATDVVRVERFQRRFRERFQGPESPGFDETVELLDRLERLERLERALRNGGFESGDAEGLDDLLGQELVRSLAGLARMRSLLVDAGYLEARGGRVALTPKAARRFGHLALAEVLAGMLPDAGGRHDTTKAGAGSVATEQGVRYEFGDPMTIDVPATLRAALVRGAARGRPVGRHFALEPGDLHVKEHQRSTRTSTVLLLDMSWSMSWEGRFAAAKKVALAMETWMRTRHPRDWFGVVGFYTRAVELKPADLAEATWNMGDPFTNLQDGLRLGSRLLERHPAATRQMIVITDGQPTAYFDGGRLVCEWPMSSGGLSSRATAETLKEVERVTRRGIRINTFMLDDTPLLHAFVQKMTAINRGRAFYTTPDRLGHFVLVDHVARRRKVL